MSFFRLFKKHQNVEKYAISQEILWLNITPTGSIKKKLHPDSQKHEAKYMGNTETLPVQKWCGPCGSTSHNEAQCWRVNNVREPEDRKGCTYILEIRFVCHQKLKRQDHC